MKLLLFLIFWMSVVWSLFFDGPLNFRSLKEVRVSIKQWERWAAKEMIPEAVGLVWEKLWLIRGLCIAALCMLIPLQLFNWFTHYPIGWDLLADFFAAIGIPGTTGARYIIKHAFHPSLQQYYRLWRTRRRRAVRRQVREFRLIRAAD